MIRHTLHVPLARNDGTPVTARELDGIESALLDIAGGFIATDGFGAWRSPDGVVYRDTIRVYMVDVDEPAEALHSLAAFVAIALEQDAVYVTTASLDVELVTPARV